MHYVWLQEADEEEYDLGDRYADALQASHISKHVKECIDTANVESSLAIHHNIHINDWITVWRDKFIIFNFRDWIVVNLIFEEAKNVK